MNCTSVIVNVEKYVLETSIALLLLLLFTIKRTDIYLPSFDTDDNFYFVQDICNILINWESLNKTFISIYVWAYWKFER